LKIISVKKENMADYGKVTSSVVYSAIVKIIDINTRASEMIQTISSTSWLSKLAPVEKKSFDATSKRTILKLVDLIQKSSSSGITAEFGEYMISDVAQNVLESQLTHKKVPLAELLKEKVSGNPGFDFHTETKGNHIAFGEAKYSSVTNPHANAVNQIVEFIGLQKDDAELTLIQHFVSKDAVSKSLSGAKAYVAAFSINSDSPQKIIDNVLRSENIDPLLSFPEVFIIGVQK
jgi:hypothetical protein